MQAIRLGVLPTRFDQLAGPEQRLGGQRESLVHGQLTNIALGLTIVGHRPLPVDSIPLLEPTQEPSGSGLDLLAATQLDESCLGLRKARHDLQSLPKQFLGLGVAPGVHRLVPLIG